MKKKSIHFKRKLLIQDQIRLNSVTLVWSFMSSYENSLNPFEDIKDSISAWEHIAQHYVSSNDTIRKKGREIAALGIDYKDAIHIAAAIYGDAQYVVTVDKRIIKKAPIIHDIIIINPINIIPLMEERQ